MGPERDVKIRISQGEKTERCLDFILNQLSDKEIDQIDIERELKSTDNLVGEPVAISAVIATSAILISAIVRLLEKYLENQRQRETLRIVIDGFEKGTDLGNALKELAVKHSDVAVSFGVAKEGW